MLYNRFIFFSQFGHRLLAQLRIHNRPITTGTGRLGSPQEPVDLTPPNHACDMRQGKKTKFG